MVILIAVPMTRPAAAAAQAPSAPRTSGILEYRPYSAASMTTTRTGISKSAVTATAAPSAPWKRCPIRMAALTVFEPGSTWPIPTNSAYSLSESHLRRSTMMCRAQGAMPPNPSRPRLRNPAKRSNRPGAGRILSSSEVMDKTISLKANPRRI